MSNTTAPSIPSRPARRLLAMLVFLAGGLAAELRQPVYCAMVHASPARLKRPGV